MCTREGGGRQLMYNKIAQYVYHRVAHYVYHRVTHYMYHTPSICTTKVPSMYQSDPSMCNRVVDHKTGRKID